MANGFDLGSILQAAQLGRSLNPEVMQQQALGNQLALQLQQLKLQEALDPNIALSRELNLALAKQGVIPSSPYRPAEITPTGESLAGITVQNAAALTPQQETLLQARDIAAEQAGLPLEIPRAVRDPRLDVRPVINPFTNQPTPFVTDLSKAIEGATETSNINEIIEAPKRAARLAEVRARYDAMGVPVRVTEDEFGNVQVIPTRMIGGQVPTASAVKTEEGTQLKGKPKAGTGIKGLTANAEQTLLGKAAFEGINLDDPVWKDENGAWKITDINIEARRKERSREDAEKQEKLANSNLSSKQEDELAAIYLTQKQLGSFKDIISNIQNTSGEPGLVQNALAVVASNPSDGIWSSLVRQGAEAFLTDDSRLKEDVRGTVSSAIQSAISGKVITRLEATQLGFIPKGDDTIARLIQKGESLEKYLKNKENGILMASGGVPSPINPTAGQTQGAIPTVTNQSQFDALPSGSLFMEDGKQYRKP